MKASKRTISMRVRIKTVEDTVNNMAMGTINSLVRAVSVLGGTFEEYIAMKNDTEKFVKHLEKVIENENRSSDTGKKKQTKGSRTTKTSGKSS